MALLVSPHGCRMPIGLHCVMRITLRAAEAGARRWRCKPCGIALEEPALYFDAWRIEPL